MLSWAHIGHAGSFGAPLVGGCGAQAVSCKTPIYFIIVNSKEKNASYQILHKNCQSGYSGLSLLIENTIRDGGNTLLSTAYTVYIAYLHRFNSFLIFVNFGTPPNH